MKHAGRAALEELAPFLAEIRKHALLREKRPGVFYLRSRAFLHFHEDPSGLFADVRLGEDFTRHPVSTTRQRQDLLRRIGRCLALAAASRHRAVGA